MDETFDLIVLGAGSAARDGAKRAAEHGARVAMVERERWGGGCPNVACRPTKAYLVAADLLHDVNELAGWMGIEVSKAQIDLARAREWKRSLQRSQESWVELLGSQGYGVVQGEAS